MKLLFSLTYYAPYVSGLTLYARRMAEALAEKSNRVDVICFRHDPSLAQRERTAGGVNIYRVVPQIRFSKGYFSVEWIWTCFRLVKDVDTVVVHLPQVEGFLTAAVARLKGKNVVSVYHCDVTFDKGLINRLLQLGVDTVNFLSLLLSRTVVVYTEDYARHSRIVRFFLRKTRVVTPPVPDPVVNKSRMTQLSQRLGRREITIGIAARLAREKGFEYLFEAYEHLTKRFPGKKIRIAVAGPTDPVGEADYKKMILERLHKLGDSVVFLGTVDPKDMGSFYALLDVLVLPSVNATEAFGLVQAEAMKAGVPVVASDLPGVRIPVRMTGMGKVVPARNPELLAVALEEVIRNRKKYSSQMQKAKTLFSLFESVVQFERAVEI